MLILTGRAARDQAIPELGPQTGQHQDWRPVLVPKQLAQPGGDLFAPISKVVKVKMRLVQPYHGAGSHRGESAQCRFRAGGVYRVPQPP